MLYELRDPYSTFLPPDRFARLNETTTGNYAGLGIEVDLRDGWLIVVAPLAGGPAERAGIQPGDRIVEIGGRSTKGWTNEEASKVLRGKPGTLVSIKIERPGISQPLELRLERTTIHQSAVRRTALRACRWQFHHGQGPTPTTSAADWWSSPPQMRRLWRRQWAEAVKEPE